MRYLISAVVLLLAVLAVTRSATAQVEPPSWYGYVVTGSTYTSTTADWTMPSLTCGPDSDNNYAAIWTGLDGYQSDTTEQIGAEAYCAGQTASYLGWYDLYPEAAVDFSSKLSPGDELTASVAYDGSSKFTLTLDDLTAGWRQTVTQTLSGSARSSAETIVEVPANLSCAPAETLADFTNDTVDGKALGSLGPVKVTGSDPHITVSDVSGKTFEVTCN
jgi:hypothetical protein